VAQTGLSHVCKQEVTAARRDCRPGKMRSGVACWRAASVPVRTARDRRKRWGRPAFHHTPASVRWAKSTRLFFISLMDRAPALKGTSSSSKLFPVDRVTASKMSRSSRGNSSILRGGEAFRFLLPSTVSSSRPRPSRAASLFRIEPARYGKFMITKIDEDPVALVINRSGHALRRRPSEIVREDMSRMLAGGELAAQTERQQLYITGTG
jgi:hypothetical protein